MTHSYGDNSYIHIDPLEGTCGQGGFFGQVIDNPRWKLSVARYVGPYKVEGKDIIINRSIVPIGRGAFAANNTFGISWDKISDIIGNVSGYTGLILDREDGLYIQYDYMTRAAEGLGVEKSPIRIKGMVLGAMESCKLTQGDVIVIGYGATNNMTGCVELVVERLYEESVHNKAILSQIDARLMRMDDKLRGLHDLEEERFAQEKKRQEELERKVELLHKQGRLKSDEEYFTLYFRGYSCREELWNALNGAERKDLRFSAIYEDDANQKPEGEIDYSAPYLYMGKLLERFAYQRIYLGFIERFSPDWVKENLEKCKHGDKLMYGNITHAFTARDKKTRAIYIPPKFVNDIVAAYNIGLVGSDCITYKEVEQAFLDCHRVGAFRNVSAHSGNQMAVEEDEADIVSYEDYIKAKSAVLDTGFIVKIDRYYRRIFGEVSE